MRLRIVMALQPDRIKQRRRALRLSQEQLAELTGVNQPQISRWELGENDITGATLTALARALSTTADWLLGLSDEVAGHVHQVGDIDPATAELLDILHTTSASRRQAILLFARTISALD